MSTITDAPVIPAVATAAFSEEVAPQVSAGTSYTAEDLAKAREQEKSKLYPELERYKAQLATFEKAEAERAVKEAEAKEARRVRDAEAAAKKKSEEEAELGFKELLALKEKELEEKVAVERIERERAFALLDREREFTELQSYRQSRLEAERDSIIPELIDLIQGNNKDEIEQSINTLKDKTAKISESVAQASQQARSNLVGTRVTAPTAGPLENDPSSQTYTPDDLRNMSMSDYAKNRSRLLGASGTNRGNGLFGN